LKKEEGLGGVGAAGPIGGGLWVTLM